VVVLDVRHVVVLHVRPDDGGRHAEAELAELRALVFVDLRGRDVVVEAAVLVVRDDEQRLRPLVLVGREETIDRRDEGLPRLDVVRWVVVVRREDERRIDDRDGRECASEAGLLEALGRVLRRGLGLLLFGCLKTDRDGTELKMPKPPVTQAKSMRRSASRQPHVGPMTEANHRSQSA
jgi:hypothetical protein